MHEALANLIDKEHARRKEASRFAKAAKPFIADLNRELSSILTQYRKEFPDDGKIAERRVLQNGLRLEIKRLPDGPTCDVLADCVHRVLRVRHDNQEPITVTVGYDKENALVLAIGDPTISAFASGVIAPILFPELMEIDG